MTSETTIGIQKDTKRRLARLGNKGETFDQILIRILDKMENKNGSQ